MILKRINSPLNIDGNIGWKRLAFLIAKCKYVRRIFFFFLYSGNRTLGDSLRNLIKIDHQNLNFLYILSTKTAKQK